MNETVVYDPEDDSLFIISFDGLNYTLETSSSTYDTTGILVSIHCINLGEL